MARHRFASAAADRRVLGRDRLLALGDLALVLAIALGGPLAGAGETKAEPSPAIRAVADLEGKLAELSKQGTGIELREHYEALLAEAAGLVERYAADPASARVHLAIARCCEALGKHPEKEAAFGRYIEALVPHSKEQAAAELRAEAEALIARRQLFPATKVLRLMLSKFPDGPEAAYALYRLGTCQLWLERFEDAAASLSEVIQRWPEAEVSVEARLRLARANMLQGKHADSISVLESVLAEVPKAPQRDAALFDLAVARYRSADPYGALLGFQQLLRESPRSPYAELARAAIARLRSDVLQRIQRPDHDHND